jgi:hypothetical protein
MEDGYAYSDARARVLRCTVAEVSFFSSSSTEPQTEGSVPAEMLEMHAVQWAQECNRGNTESRRFELSPSPLVACMMHAHTLAAR